MKQFKFATLLALLVSALAAVLLPVGAASASTEPPDGSGWARFGHFAPEETAVDVWVDGEMFVADISFKTVSDYKPLPAGPHNFEVRPAGDVDATPILSVEAGVPDNGSITIGAVSTRDGVAPQVYNDALVQPDPGASLVRFIHAAPDVAAVDVNVVEGPELATDVPYPDATGYQAIQPGTYTVEVTDAMSGDPLLRVSDWEITPGVQASIAIVRGADGQIDVAPVEDAVATAVAPVGGIQTGGGSMADALDPLAADSSFPTVSVALLIGAAALGACVAGTRFRRTVSPTSP